MNQASLLDVLEAYPSWPHAPRDATAAQVGRFAASVLRGATLLGWPDEDRPRAVAAVQDAPWDSARLGVKAGRLFVVVPPAAIDGAVELVAGTLAAAAGAGFRYLVTRIDAGDLAVVQVLEKAGFLVVDAILSQYLQVGAAPPLTAPPDVAVRLVDLADGDALAALADGCFTMSRFHCDPWIGEERGRAIYRDWARNLAAGLNELTLVAEIDGAVAGFLSCRDVADTRPSYGFGYGRIELVAVAETARGRGVVASLNRRLIAESPSRGWNLLGIGTQIANVRAMRAYQNVGFIPGDSIFTLRHLV